LTAGASSVARWLGCDKADVFLYDERRSSLAAIGTSATPLGELQRKLGLDVMPVAQGGRRLGLGGRGRGLRRYVDDRYRAPARALMALAHRG
jgi:hypothetical protein